MVAVTSSGIKYGFLTWNTWKVKSGKTLKLELLTSVYILSINPWSRPKQKTTLKEKKKEWKAGLDDYVTISRSRLDGWYSHNESSLKVRAKSGEKSARSRTNLFYYSVLPSGRVVGPGAVLSPLMEQIDQTRDGRSTIYLELRGVRSTGHSWFESSRIKID